MRRAGQLGSSKRLPACWGVLLRRQRKIQEVFLAAKERGALGCCFKFGIDREWKKDNKWRWGFGMGLCGVEMGANYRTWRVSVRGNKLRRRRKKIENVIN